MRKQIAWMIVLMLMVPLMTDFAMAETGENICTPMEELVDQSQASTTKEPDLMAMESSYVPTPEPMTAELSPTPASEPLTVALSPTPAPETIVAEPSPTPVPDTPEASYESTQPETEIGAADVDIMPDPEAMVVSDTEQKARIQQGLEKVQRQSNVNWRGVEISGEQGMAIPKLFQQDYPETVCIYDGITRSVSTSGCGAACLSMVIVYLTGDRTQNPYTLFCEAVDCGWYSGNGLGKSALSSLAQSHSLKAQWIPNNSERILAELEAGHPIIAHMGEGIFTGQGHYIVLRGVIENDEILVNDPNSCSNSGKTFSISLLLRQARTDNAFMVCCADT